jgi:hypothetical protein
MFDLKIIDGIPFGHIKELMFDPIKIVLMLATWYYLPRIVAISKLSAQGFKNISVFDEVYIV